jgi:hypothetical protein
VVLHAAVVVRLCLALALAHLASLTSAARAESPEHALADSELRHRLWIRAIGYGGKPGGQRTLVIAPRFGGAFLLGDRVDLDIEVPLALANLQVAGETETRTLPGNPFIGVSLVSAVRSSRFSLGLGGAAPVARNKPSDAHDTTIFRYARAARAGREAWLYTPDRAAVVLSGALEHKVEHGPALGFDAAIAVMPRVRGPGAAVTNTTQLGVSAAGVVSDSLRLGGRVDAVLLSAEEAERLQFALVPFLHVSTSDGVMFALEVTVNLDDPYGLSFKDDGVWGLSLLAGSRF